MLRSIVYTSSATGVMDQNSLTQILHECVEWNIPHEISGLLIYYDGTFVQVIEGNHDDVGNIFKKIETDSRHRNVTKLHDEQIKEREFDIWEMAFRNIKGADLENLKDYIPLDELNFGNILRKGSAKNLLRAFYEMNVNTNKKYEFDD